MSDEATNVYEGLFLFPQSATGNLQAAVDHLTSLFERVGAELISLAKWDERRLAYEIKGNKRGVYFLAYLRVAGTKMSEFERACNLSEHLLRAMMTRADHPDAATIEAADGREKLADEIKMRGEQSAAEAKPAAVVAPATPAAPPEAAPPEAAPPEAAPAETAPVAAAAEGGGEGETPAAG
jgi:small subunit ribosomal protein S6